jgi:DNA-binding NtrC family response regulator
MPRVVISKGTAFLKECAFSGVDIITIGRARSNDLFLPDPARKVSRYHAAIVRAKVHPERYFVRDLSSLRATKLNGEIVFQRLLEDGDVVGIADYELTYFGQPPEKRAFSRLSVVPKRVEAAVVDKSTMLFTHSELMKEIPIAAGRREVVEEVLRRAARVGSLAELLEQAMASIVRVMGAERGFAGIFLAAGDYEEVGATGLRPDEQVEVSDPGFRERIQQGKNVLDETTLLVPILLHDQALGFFCVDRAPSAEPFSTDEANFLLTVGRIAAAHVGEGRGRRRAKGEETPLEWPMEMVGKSKVMLQVYDQIREAAATDTNVLVLGESGTGKELVARAIHAHSAHARGKIVAHNCAEITESLAEAVVFGYAPKSGISGADPQGAPGWFELAHGGTLFLDEVQALGPTLQDKFLRVLQEKVVWRVRGKEPIPVAVNVVAATDQDLEAAIERGAFRAPLYYRFGKQIRVPPLRERPEDIPLLAHYFLDRYAVKFNGRARSLSHRALHRLVSYHWPGNVRELENYIKDAVAKNPDKEVLLSWDFAQLPEAPPEAAIEEAGAPEPDAAPEPPPPAAPRPMREVEKEEILEALEATQGNITKAAKLLGYKSRQTMLNKMDRYGIPRQHGDPEARS